MTLRTDKYAQGRTVEVYRPGEQARVFRDASSNVIVPASRYCQSIVTTFAGVVIPFSTTVRGVEAGKRLDAAACVSLLATISPPPARAQIREAMCTPLP